MRWRSRSKQTPEKKASRNQTAHNATAERPEFSLGQHEPLAFDETSERMEGRYAATDNFQAKTMIGTARIIPIGPQTTPQISTERKTTSGETRTALPTYRGSRTAPITPLSVSRPIATPTVDQAECVGSIDASKIGGIEATKAPTVGMKLSGNAINPQNRAKSTSANSRKNPNCNRCERADEGLGDNIPTHIGGDPLQIG